MEEVEWNNLVPGDIYYIERIKNLKKETESGKAVGSFFQIDKDENGTAYALFNKLSVLPNATKPSGMGKNVNHYSTLDYKFYKPSAKRERILEADKEEVQNRKTLINITLDKWQDDMLKPKDGSGNDDVAELAKSFLGGKRKSKKQRKSKRRRTRRNIRNKKGSRRK